MERNSLPRIYGLIGYPVSHSLSPQMHNAAFRTLKINAEYKLFALKPQELEKFLKTAALNNLFGLNVTIPYKETVIPFLDFVAPEAKLIKAVNTIKVNQDKLEGFNTDGKGFLRHLIEDLKFIPRDKIIAIIGAGGAARAISVYLGKEKPKSIAIYDIDKSKTTALINHLKNNFKDIDFKMAPSVKELDILSCNLLINATPVGMKENDPELVDRNLIHRGLLVYDVIYNPCETKFLKLAREKGAHTSNGLGMLLYQGVDALELWLNPIKAPVEIMRRALTEEAYK